MSRSLSIITAGEVIAVLAIAVAPIGYVFPVGVPLLAVASVSRWLRGHSWAEVVHGPAPRSAAKSGEVPPFAVEQREAEHATPLAPTLDVVPAAVLGCAVGAVAIALAAPLLGLSGVTALDWWIVPAVRAGAAQLVPALAVLVASAVALELALRGWIIERVFELSPGPASVPIATAAIAEGLVTGGPVASRLGIALFGAGLGILYVAAGRTIVAPVAARVAFVIGAVIIERL